MDTWVEQAGEPEIPLVGGDVTEGLVRVGNTVRRPAGTGLARDLLIQLESVGFVGAPRYLGVDSRGREAFSELRLQPPPQLIPARPCGRGGG